MSIICPFGGGRERLFDAIDRIHIYRYRLTVEALSRHESRLEQLKILPRDKWLKRGRRYLVGNIEGMENRKASRCCSRPPDI